MESTFDKLCKAIRVVMEEDLEIKPESTFQGDLKCDSLDVVEILMAAEEEFDMEIPDAEAEKCVTVADAVALLDRVISEKAS